MLSIFKKGIKIDLASSLVPVIEQLTPLIEKEIKKKYKKGLTDGLVIGAGVGIILGVLITMYGSDKSAKI